MFASIAVLALAASSVFAAPTPQAVDAAGFKPSRGPRGGACDISTLTVPNLAGLAAPSGAPSFVGVGVGTQNYTCGAAGTYTYVASSLQSDLSSDFPAVPPEQWLTSSTFRASLVPLCLTVSKTQR